MKPIRKRLYRTFRFADLKKGQVYGTVFKAEFVTVCFEGTKQTDLGEMYQFKIYGHRKKSKFKPQELVEYSRSSLLILNQEFYQAQ